MDIEQYERMLQMSDKKSQRIVVTEDGPYMVIGGLPLREMNINRVDKHYEYQEVKTYDTEETYTLCRCGLSENFPFCDGKHIGSGVDFEETADKNTYEERASFREGEDLDLKDDHRCAVAKFCHRDKGSVWQLLKDTDDPEIKEEAIKGAIECPAGRLEAYDKDGRSYEPELEPGIDILIDTENDMLGSLYVKGGVVVESADGTEYEVRNRMALCRCGKSKHKPFCDGQHLYDKLLEERKREEEEKGKC